MGACVRRQRIPIKALIPPTDLAGRSAGDGRRPAPTTLTIPNVPYSWAAVGQGSGYRSEECYLPNEMLRKHKTQDECDEYDG